MGQSQQKRPDFGGQRGQSSGSDQALAPRNNQLPAKEENRGVGETLKSWWNKGTSWLGEKYDAASHAVSEKIGRAHV